MLASIWLTIFALAVLSIISGFVFFKKHDVLVVVGATLLILCGTIGVADGIEIENGQTISFYTCANCTNETYLVNDSYINFKDYQVNSTNVGLLVLLCLILVAALVIFKWFLLKREVKRDRARDVADKYYDEE